MVDVSGIDVIIAGGGPVGATLALLARARGIRTTLIAADADTRQHTGPTPAVCRPIALSHASAHMLRGLGALRAHDATPIESIHVSQRAHFGRTLMQARDQGVPALGYVIDAGVLGERLRSSCPPPLSARGEVTAWQAEEDGVAVEWTDGAGAACRNRARLLVIADGGERAVATDPAGIMPAPGSGAPERPRTRRDYGQQAIVCSVHASLPHRGVAYERFTASGPLALLPYEDRYAVVWSLPTARARELLRSDDAAFIRTLQDTFGMRQGWLSAPGTRLAYPLVLRRSEEIRPRVVSVGNAAQTLHPVAGQGLNLGLRDVMALVDQLVAQRDSIGSDRFVKHYYGRRLADRAATIAITDTLARVFAVEVPFAPLLRGAALTALDAFSPARNFFARRMILGARGL